MGAIKRSLKRLLLGRSGLRTRTVRRGLLRGLRFNIDSTSKAMRLIGFDEREIASEVQARGRDAACAFDVGANDGWYATHFASLPNIRTVFAFEPQPDLRDRLRENLRINGPDLEGKVEISGKMVGDRDGDAWCRLDSFIEQAQEPLVLKVDVDGGELDVLKGAKAILSRRRCSLVVETHTPELERDCISFLHSLGYQTRIIDKGWYRAFVPENRTIPHNRWFVATRAQ